MTVTFTRTDPDNTPITYLADKIVSFAPEIRSTNIPRASGWSEPKTRIFDVTDSENSIGMGVIEDYEFVKALIENAIANK